MFSTITQHFKKATPAFHFSPIDDVLMKRFDTNDSESPCLSAARIAAMPIEPAFRPHFEQPRSDLAGFFSALREAAERFDMIHIAPLVALDPTVRFQLRTVTVKTSPDNDLILRELETLQQHIIKKAAQNCLKQSQSAENLDLSGFYGVIIIPNDEAAAGETVLTLATIGIERINLSFGFEGEHVSINQSEPQTEDVPVSASDLSLQLRYPDGHREALAAEFFPLVIGNSTTAGIRVAGTYVSREHATLFYDAELRRVVLQDHSRHGTWFNGKALARNGRVILSGSGEIALSPQLEDAPVIEFNHAALDPLQCTPLVAPYSIDVTTQVLAGPVGAIAAESSSPVSVMATVAESVQPPSPDKGATPLREPIATSPVVADPATSHAAGETQMAPNCGLRAFGYLQVRDKSGITTVPITQFPFVIGREPEGPGYTVDSQASFVSREHLTLMSFVHGLFKVENHGLGRNNTFRKGAIQDNHFYYRPAMPNSDNGWLVLGGRILDEKCIEIRLLSGSSEAVQ